ncbi:SbcC/MukB-like Walker B domain-containing protein [Streptomyces sp. NPDC015350]|uniref:SbcC/MukB-like Walker B domain-containing protein n=1 Tax=Streptomyces sp. NPDC015350 TaxID=3364955 RepID=UPI00370179CF
MSAVAEIERWWRRWHLIGAGVDNVWYYTREWLPCPSGRWLARGPNGTGKTTLLEGLCPFLLNPVHMHLSSASGRATSLVSLMKGGSSGKRRFGYMWLSFGPPGDPASGDADAGEQHYGLRLEYAASSNSVETVPFRLPVVPGHDGQDLSIMKQDDFCAWVAAQGGEVFASTDAYVADLAQRVFGCGPGTLKRIARRIKKVRNPGLLAGLSPADAAAELRMALPTVSADTVRLTQEALAAAEATRRRYERDAKTAQVLEDLSAAWSYAAAKAGTQAVDAALACADALARNRAEALQAHTDAEARRLELDDLRVLIRDRTAAELQAGQHADALARDAASSDVAHAHTKVAQAQKGHEKDCELLTAHTRAASRCAGDVQDAADAVTGLMTKVALSCRTAQVPVPAAVTAAVSVRRSEPSPLRIGERDFGQAPGVDAVVDEETVEQAAEQLEQARTRLARRGESAGMTVVAYQRVATAQEESRQARSLADAAAETAREAAARHRETLERAQACVADLAGGVQAWTQTVREQFRTPLMDLAALAAQAGEWCEGQECSSVVHDAGKLARKMTRTAAQSGERARSRADHHTGRAEQARRCAAEAAERARRLESGELLPLPGPSWHREVDEERAFACVVEWVSPQTGAGAVGDVAEAVMAAAGLLSAEVTEHGADGHGRWLVHPHGPVLPEEQSLAAVLRAAPGHPLQEVTTRVLRRIAYLPSAVGAEADHVGAGLVVGADGTFRTGATTGRLLAGAGQVPRASHIGTAVRQAATLRAAAAAQAECDRWQQRATGHAQTAHRLHRFAEALQELAAQFPHAKVAASERAESTRAEASRAAHTAAAHASEQDRAAQHKESSHRAALGQWRASAVALGLPDTIAAVRQEAEDAGARAAAVGTAAGLVRDAGLLLAKVTQAAGQAAEAGAQAQQAAQAARASHAALLAARAELEACRQRSGMDEIALAQAAQDASAAHQAAKEQLEDAQSRMESVSGKAADTARAAVEANRSLEQAEPAARASLERVRDLIAFDALHELLDRPPQDPCDEDAGTWLADLQERLAAVPAASVPLEECAMAVRLHLADEDDDWQLTHGQAHGELPAHQVTLSGHKAMSPPAAAREATARLHAAQSAYNAAEDQALQTFVLGRIPTAISNAWVDLHDWVDDINDQMKLARASSGLLVQLRVRLAPDLTPARARIHHLTCEIGDANRTPEQQHSVGQELLAVMRHGEDGGSTDRATRLAEAIDIRNWVTVDYVVVRGDSGTKETWGRKKTTVSGGESRLIVLAPMLAALAAEYRDLPAHALRLCALDEVPGEIDQAGRDGIAAYTASLDLDLMCTSHHWDGSPGAWDGIDIHDLAKSTTGIIIAEPMHLYTRQMLAATSHLPAQNAGPETETAGPEAAREATQ